MIETLMALVMPILAIAQGDILRFKSSHERDLTCEITALSCKEVHYFVQGVSQKRDAREVAEIVLSGDKRFDYASGLEALAKGRPEEAEKCFSKVLKSPQESSVTKQFAYKALIETYLDWEQPDRAVETCAKMRVEMPESFFLVDTYILQFDAYRRKGDGSGMERTLDEFAPRAKELGIGERAELLKADLYEAKRNFAEALAVHRKYLQDRDPGVAENAQLGELRCLMNLPTQIDALRTRAESIISRKSSNVRLLVAGYNALGFYSLAKKQTKEALLSLLRGVAQYDQKVQGMAEHEAALGLSAVAAARYAAEQTDAGVKAEYKRRAQELLAELTRLYGNRSSYIETAKKEIAAVR